ncbi:MAG: NAD(P)/FAD-dependent oxidoreductase [Clostridiales bacterium]|nr:NAD(P)/FAD-dependent oxidoreductase [Clostridiales bacterium]
MENKKKNGTAIIIGAGPAGLTAAYCLLTETGIKPIVLEQEDFVGGISRTAEYNGNRIDIGGHRFFTKSDEVNALWEHFMPLQGKPSIDDKILGTTDKLLSPNGPDPEVEDRVMLLRRRVSRIYYLKKFFDYPITLSARTFRNMGLGRTVAAGFGYLWSAIFKKKEDSLANFYINRFGRPLYEMFFEDYTEKVWGKNPRDIAADWGAQRVKGLSLMKAVWNVISKPFRRGGAKVETSLIEQYKYPKKGPGQLYEVMASEIERLGGEIIRGARVTKIITEGNRVIKVVAEQNGCELDFPGDVFFSSMPVKDLITGMEGVPEDVRRVALELPYRDFMTVGLLVKKLKIENKTKLKTLGNIVPDCWIYIQEREVKLGRLQIFNNWSPYMLKDPQNTVWIGLEYFCNEGDEYWNMEDSKFIEFAVQELATIGIIDPADVLDSVRIRVKKAYPAYFGSYSEFGRVREYLSGIENLWCIGRNGQHKYNNMDHSMLTALTAVRCVKAGITDKTAVWEVNTEKEYHEVKTENDK